ncbi:hypothetical protein Dimus_037761, partial [Dionaea muscipula]
MHPGDRSPGSQGKAVIREDEWKLVRASDEVLVPILTPRAADTGGGAILKQKLKDEWVANMDRGSSYFYAVLKSRRKRSCISSLVTDEGDVVMNDRDIGREFIRFFRGLLGTAKEADCRLDPERAVF